MSRRIEWTTAATAEVDIHDKGEDLGYDEAIDAELGLFIGSGEDGLLIEGSKAELVALLRRLIKRVEAHVPAEPVTESDCWMCGEPIRLAEDPGDGKGAGWLSVDTGTRFCEDDDSGARHEPSEPNL